jgi:hypothetical protein
VICITPAPLPALEPKRVPKKHFDTSGKSAARIHHRAICKPAMALPIGHPARSQTNNSHNRSCTARKANDRLRVPDGTRLHVPEEIST